MRTHWLCVLLCASPAWSQPLLEYTFDDQTNPTANSGTLGSSYDGALVGDAAFVPFGSGFALSLDGDQDVVSPGGDVAGLDVGDGDFTLFSRFQTSNFEPGASGNRFLFMREGVGNDPTYVLGVERDSGVLTFNIADGGDFVSTLGTRPVNDGATHEVLAARSGDMLRIFLDGVFEAESTVPPGFGSTTATSDLTVGGRLIATDDDFLGLIDEVAIYDVALDAGCGDGIALGAEECDDGNTVAGDGCDAACMTEVPEPSRMLLLTTGVLVLLGVRAFRTASRSPERLAS